MQILIPPVIFFLVSASYFAWIAPDVFINQRELFVAGYAGLILGSIVSVIVVTTFGWELVGWLSPWIGSCLFAAGVQE